MQACAVELHLDIAQVPLYTEIYRKNAADQNRAADFVRACAVETDINMSEEPLYTEIYREKAAGQNFARPSSVLASTKALFRGFTNRTVGITRFATNSSKKK